MKTKILRTKIKNFLCVALVVVALLLSSNFSLAYGAINSIRNMAHAEYKATETVSPYEFTTTSGWDRRTNATSGSALMTAFNTSTVSFDLTKVDSDLTRPSTKYNGDVVPIPEGKSSEIDNFAMTLQAKEAPTKITADKKDKDGNVLYKKDNNGNFVYEDRIYSASEVEGQDMNDFVAVDPEAETKTYKKKTYTLNGDGSKDYKKDEDDNFIFEDRVYTKDEISGSSEAYDQIEDTGTYNKRVVEQEENAFAYYGYRTTSSITLRANSFYVFSFWVWTTKGTTATFVVNKGTTYDAEVKIADTNGKWVKYYLFFEADSNSSSSVYLTLYFGSKDKLTDGDASTVNGSIFLDNLCVNTISQTDYNTKTITGEKAEDRPENAVFETVSMRDDIAIAALKPSFQDFDPEADVLSKMYKDEGYTSLASHYNKDYNGEDVQAFEKFVSRYTDDNGTEDMANEQIDQLKRAYRDYFNMEVVEEAKTFQVDDLDEDGNVKEEDGKPVKKDGFSSFNADNKILKLENKSEMHQLGLISAPIIVKQFGYYRLSIFIKADDKDAKAVIKLTSNLITGDSGEKGKMQVKSQSIDAFTDEAEITNNWKEVVFYVQGNCFYDWYMQLVILADTESTIYIDNIRFENITSDTYRNQSSSYRFDLAPTSIEPASKIENGYFNSITTSEVNSEKALKNIPYTPYGWSKLDNCTSGVVAGIVSTNETLFTQEMYKDENGEYISVQNKLGSVEVPKTVKTYLDNKTVEMPRTNVLAIYSPSLSKLNEVDRNKIAESKFKGHYYGYKSSQFSLSSNSVYEVSFEVFFAKGLTTSDCDGAFEGTLFANLIYSDKHIAEFETKIEKETTQTGVWQKYTFFVRTGSSSRTLYLELGVKDAYGTAFFQNVDYKTYEEKDNPDDKDDKITIDEQFYAKAKEFDTIEKQNTNNARFIDFDGSPTQMVSSQKVENKDYYSSLSHALRTSDRDDKELIQGELGVIDTSKEFKLTDTRTFAAEELANPNGTSKFAMMIYNGEKYNTVVYPNTKSSLTSSSFYEISLYVRTIDIDKDHGLTITIDNISVRFDKINTQDGTFKAKDDMNGYTKLTALVKTGSSTISGISINYELGTDSDKTTGIALISDISIKKLADEDEYNELVDAVQENDPTTVVKNFLVPSTTSDGDDDADNLTLATFFLVFSSILLVAVLVFAVVAVYVKKIPKKASASAPAENKDNTPKDGFV